MSAPVLPEVTAHRRGALVHLPPDWTLYRAFRLAFPRARPAAAAYHWYVHGRHAGRRVARWWEAEAARAAAERRREQREAVDGEWDRAGGGL